MIPTGSKSITRDMVLRDVEDAHKVLKERFPGKTIVMVFDGSSCHLTMPKSCFRKKVTLNASKSGPGDCELCAQS